jgi:hypothetical protein
MVRGSSALRGRWALTPTSPSRQRCGVRLVWRLSVNIGTIIQRSAADHLLLDNQGHQDHYTLSLWLMA